MRILIVTQEEPFYLPPFLQKIVDERKKDIAGIVILSPAGAHKSWRLLIMRHLNLYGLRVFLLQSLRFLYYKILDRVSYMFNTRHRLYSAKAIAFRYSLPVYGPSNINAPEFLDIIAKEIQPDVIVSVAASQVFKRDILNLPKLGCINIHSALLPKYRGMLPTFWALTNGERQTGVTVHYMDEQLDNGDIILQTRVPISPTDTLDSLIVKCKKVGANLLLQALDKIENGTVNSQPNNSKQATYFSFPTKEDVKKFRAQGRKFM